MTPPETLRISNKLSSLETEVRLKNEQNNVDHIQIKEQLGRIDGKLNTVIFDHDKRLNTLEGDVKAVVMPLLDFRDNMFKKLIQFSLLGGVAGLVIYLIVRSN
jgi:hypothetical protein